MFGLIFLASLSQAETSSAVSDKTYPSDVIRKLIVETDSGQIRLGSLLRGDAWMSGSRINDRPVTVHISAATPGDDCEITQELHDGTLRLSASAKKSNDGAAKHCAAGFDVNSLTSNEVHVHTRSGDVETFVSFGAVEIFSGSGSIKAMGGPRELTIRTNSGEIRADIALTAKTESGHVSLDWRLGAPSGTMNIKTDSGNLTASFPKITKLKTSLHSATGSSKTDFNDDDSRLLLTFDSDSGSATITRKQ